MNPLFLIKITDLNKGSVALFETVVERDLLEVNLTRFPEAFLALLLLGGEELRDVGVVTLRHVLVPTLLHLIVLHMVDIFHLKRHHIRFLIPIAQQNWPFNFSVR